jgi:uncharacterized sulfatase
VSFVDLAPTLLSIIGQEAPAWMQGRAFAGSHAKADPGLLYGFRGRMDERMDMLRSVTDGRYVYLRQYMPHLPYGQHVSYMFLMPTAQVWKKLYDEGKLNEAQRAFWEAKPGEELYDLQSDPHEVNNLAESKEKAHVEALAKLRAAHAAHMERTRDLGFIPEAERLRLAQDRSPKDFFSSDAEYPFAQVFKLAEQATDRSQKGTGAFTAALSDGNAIVRYWAVMGLRLREQDGVKAGHDGLVKALGDESPSVRVAAADALAQFGGAGDLDKALEALVAAADPTKNSNATATEALNAITNVGGKAASVKEKLAALPRKANGGPARVSEYPSRLFMTLLDEREPEAKAKAKAKGKGKGK